MTANEQASLNEVKTTQAVMKEHQKMMQEDIEELKGMAKDTNSIVSELKQTIDELKGGKRALIYLTGLALTIAGMVVAFIHRNQR